MTLHFVGILVNATSPEAAEALARKIEDKDKQFRG